MRYGGDREELGGDLEAVQLHEGTGAHLHGEHPAHRWQILSARLARGKPY